MERLTKWNGKKYILPQGRTSDGQSYWRIIAERLAAYEDTGLSPAEVMEIAEKYGVKTDGKRSTKESGRQIRQENGEDLRFETEQENGRRHN